MEVRATSFMESAVTVSVSLSAKSIAAMPV